MAEYIPVVRERLAGRAWRRPADYGFARKEALVPISPAELPHAAIALPVAFASTGRHLSLVAVLSPTPGSNLFVGPEGTWLAAYVPLCLRTFPFRLLPASGGDHVLCFDREATAEVPSGQGFDFFAAGNELGSQTKFVFELLVHFERDRMLATTLIEELAAAGLVRPWKPRLSVGGQVREVEGLQSVDPAGLRTLDESTLLSLRKSGALSMAYAQVLSRVQVHRWAEVARLRAKLASVTPAAGGAFGLTDDQSLHF